MGKNIFDITTCEYSNNYSMKDFEKWKLPNDYHCVYILENGRDAYIGETLVAEVRAQQHRNKYWNLDFKRMHYYYKRSDGRNAGKTL